MIVKTRSALDWSRQCEYVYRIMASGSPHVGNLGAQFRHFQIEAGHHADVLLSIHRVGDGADRNIAAEDRFPQFLPRVDIKSSETPAHVTVKHQATRRRQ